MALPCPPSADSVSVIESCPLTWSEWDKRALLKNCSMYPQTCFKPLEYHCLLNPYGNESLEVCAPNTWLAEDFCPSYNINEQRILEQRNCTSLLPDCPTKQYFSNTILNHTGCLKELPTRSSTPIPTSFSSDNDMSVASVTQSTVENISSTMSDDSTTSSKNQWLIPVIVIPILILIAVAVMIIYWKKRKGKGFRMRCFKEKEDEESGELPGEDKDNSNQRTPLLDPTKTSNESVKNTNEEILEERVDNQGTSTEEQQDEGIHDTDQKTPLLDQLNTKESLKETNDSKNEIEMDNLKPSTETQQDDENKRNSSQETPKPDSGKADITADDSRDDSRAAAENHQGEVIDAPTEKKSSTEETNELQDTEDQHSSTSENSPDEVRSTDTQSDSEEDNPEDKPSEKGPFPWKHKPPPEIKIASKYDTSNKKHPTQKKENKKSCEPEKERIYGPPLHKKDKSNDFELVVALDFGTTYSGYAFWSKKKPAEITCGKWTSNSTEVLESQKTPTALLIKRNDDGWVRFGYEAERVFKELLNDNKDRDYRFFNKFKMQLHLKKEFDKEYEVKDHLDVHEMAIKVFSLSIEYLKKKCMKDVEENGFMCQDEEKIQWILTVPSIWENSAKQFMREAAENAGIPSSQLKLALEPEAAAIYVTKETKVLKDKSMQSFDPGTRIMVADLGGGTADFTALEILADGRMKQFHIPIGGPWGGNNINTKIWEKLENIFEKDVIARFKENTAEYMEMENKIEMRKRNLTTTKKLELDFPAPFHNICKEMTKKSFSDKITSSWLYRSGQIIEQKGKLVLKSEVMKSIFEETLSSTFQNIKLAFGDRNQLPINDILLVGGFSHSEMIRDKFKSQFSKFKVITPIEPELAVLKGAVMFGLDSNIITSRVSPHTYGFARWKRFTKDDPEEKKVEENGTDYCCDIFEKMVTCGDSVDNGKTVKKTVNAASADMKEMKLDFYMSNEKNPKYVTDDGCNLIGELIVDMPDITGGKDRSVEVSISFGETEISVHGFDKTSKNGRESKLIFFRKNT